MTREEAAAALGVSVDATVAEIQRAFTAGARTSHPDRFSGATKEQSQQAAQEFIRLTSARDVLLQSRPAGPAGSPVGGAVFTVHYRSRRITWQGLAAWLSVLAVAVFVSIVGAELPFTIAEPLVRFTLLTVGLIGYARTGRQGFLVLIVVCIAVTAVLTITFTTFGALLGMFLAAFPVIGLVLAGRTQRVTASRMQYGSAPGVDGL
jgi:hypothetical protein